MNEMQESANNLFMVLYADYRYDGRRSCVTYFAKTYREVKRMFFEEFKNEPVSWLGMELLQYGFGAV